MLRASLVIVAYFGLILVSNQAMGAECTITPQSSTVVIEGTATRDNLIISGGTVPFIHLSLLCGNGQTVERDLDQYSFQTLLFNAGDGDDYFSNRTTKPAAAIMGAGNDSAYGKYGGQLFDGGAGDDGFQVSSDNNLSCLFQRGNTIIGGPGNDFIYSADKGTIPDLILMGPGADYVVVDAYTVVCGIADTRTKVADIVLDASSEDTVLRR